MFAYFIADRIGMAETLPLHDFKLQQITTGMRKLMNAEALGHDDFSPSSSSPRQAGHARFCGGFVF